MARSSVVEPGLGKLLDLSLLAHLLQENDVGLHGLQTPIEIVETFRQSAFEALDEIDESFESVDHVRLLRLMERSRYTRC
jgi:hypothetical protein